MISCRRKLRLSILLAGAFACVVNLAVAQTTNIATVPLVVDKMSGDSPTFINGQLLGSLKKLPVSGWTYHEQVELCTRINAGDAGALATLRAQVDKGEPWAQRIMAGYFKKSTIVQPDIEQAIKLYRAAALQGDVSAQHALGWILSGAGRPPADHVQARSWLRKAADQDDHEAMVRLGEMLRDGQGGPPDKAEAFQQFRAAALAENADGQLNFAAAYFNGEGVRADPVQAYKWLLIASRVAGTGSFGASVNSATETVTARLTDGQSVEANRQAAAWLSSHPRMVNRWPPQQIVAASTQGSPASGPCIRSPQRREASTARSNYCSRSAPMAASPKRS